MKQILKHGIMMAVFFSTAELQCLYTYRESHSKWRLSDRGDGSK